MYNKLLCTALTTVMENAGLLAANATEAAMVTIKTNALVAGNAQHGIKWGVF
jgi:hypothetical protein